MNRLHSELQRLFGPRSNVLAAADERGAVAFAPAQPVCAMVMALTSSPTWKELGQVWRGVQSELGLPAPAIAVAGAGGLQLWFSLAEPVAAPRALAFLDALRVRFLPDVEAGRVRCRPYWGPLLPSTPKAVPDVVPGNLQTIPALLDETGRWSAFVASDLVAVFEDTPWLDGEPSEEGQSALLRGLAVMERSAFERACLQLGLPPEFQGTGTEVVDPITAVARGLDSTLLPSPTAAAAAAEADPRRFLLQVMNDSTVALALRVEAAKALLQHPAQHPSAVPD
jgi:hypothetical protein